MNKKVTSLILTSLLATTSLTACNKTTSPPDNGGENEAQKNPLVVAYFADFRGKNGMEDYIAKFTEETGIKVTPKPVTGDFADNLKTGFASKTEPDVFFMDIHQFGNFSDAGLLLDLNNYVSKEHMSKFNQNLLGMFKHDGQTLGIPKDYNTLGLFYNKNMFDEASVDYPTDNWTWDDLMEANKKLKAHFDSKGKHAMVLQNEIARFQPILEIAGANFSYEDKGYPIVNTPEMAKGFEMWETLFKDGYATTPAELGKSWDGDSFDEQFAAMTIDGNWMNSYLAGTGNNVPYGVVQIPSMNGKKANMFFTVSWSATTNTKQPKNAAKFIEWITSDYMIRELMADGGGAIPPTLELEQEFIDMYPERIGFVEAGKIASPFDYGIASPGIVKTLGDFAEKLKLGKISNISSSLDEAQKAIEEEYNRLK